MSGAFELSIDLAAEIRNITQKQHLNAVHYAVQLVRHALRHRPSAIDIKTSDDGFEIEHDGQPFDEGELHLLEVLLTNVDTDARQSALTELENLHGVALLSLCLHRDETVVRSARSFISRRGALERLPEVRPTGYAISVKRDGAATKEETQELAFYCRHADVPVFLNGKRLDRGPVEQEKTQCLFELVRANEQDAFRLGVPWTGDLFRTRIYKQGVYVGVRQRVPNDGLCLEAVYNSRSTEFEENFRPTVRAAGAAVQAGKQKLLDGIAKRYREMGLRQRRHARQALLGMAPSLWSGGVRTLPLFDSPWARETLSLADLARTGNRLGMVPYVPRGASAPPGLLDLLMADEEELAALGRLLDVPLRRAIFRDEPGFVGRIRGLISRMRNRGPEALTLPVPSGAPPEVAAMVEALQQQGDWFIPVSNGERRVHRRAGERVTILPVEDPLVVRCASLYVRQPRALEVIRAALAAPREPFNA